MGSKMYDYSMERKPTMQDLIEQLGKNPKLTALGVAVVSWAAGVTWRIIALERRAPKVTVADCDKAQHNCTELRAAEYKDLSNQIHSLTELILANNAAVERVSERQELQYKAHYQELLKFFSELKN